MDLEDLEALASSGGDGGVMRLRARLERMGEDQLRDTAFEAILELARRPDEGTYYDDEF